ncbi:SWI/SNF and RSC complex subunit Ssr1 [Quaeritorhiza haematococci]|nr:SWI/SNF and RSC complex subunit Ssr1 [Quaeritorhiza haematococci]
MRWPLLRSLLLLGAILLASCVCFVKADANEDEEFLKVMEEQLQKENPVGTEKQDVAFTHVFPKNPFNIINSGEKTELLIGMTNTGNQPISVFGISGFFAHPQNYSHIVRNLTGYRYDVTLQPGHEATIPFVFQIESEAMEYGLVVLVDYIDNEDTPHRAVAFSGAVTFANSDSMFDLQSLFLYFLGLAIVGGVGYLSYQSFVGGTKKTRKARPAPVVPDVKDETGTKSDTFDTDWIPEHVLKSQDAAAKRTSPRLKKRAK